MSTRRMTFGSLLVNPAIPDRMFSDEAECFLKQGFSGFLMMPSGGPRGVREGDQVGRVTVVVDHPLLPDNLRECAAFDKLGNGEFANGEDKAGFEDFKLLLEPQRTGRNFVRIRHAIPSLRIFTRKAATNRCEINPAAHGFLIPSQGGFQPAKKRFSGRPCKGPSKQRLLVARGLADQKDTAVDGPTGYDGFVHRRTSPASAQSGKMRFDAGKLLCVFRSGWRNVDVVDGRLHRSFIARVREAARITRHSRCGLSVCRIHTTRHSPGQGRKRPLRLADLPVSPWRLRGQSPSPGQFSPSVPHIRHQSHLSNPHSDSL